MDPEVHPEGWTRETYAARYQDLSHAFQHLCAAICKADSGQRDWTKYHLMRTTQNWPEEWNATLLHEKADRALRVLRDLEELYAEHEE